MVTDMKDKKSTTTLFNMLSSTKDIDTFLDNYDSELEPIEFTVYLNQLASERACSIPDIIKKGYINESYCYQLFNGTRKPSRDKIIQLGFALGLNLYEVNKLLKAGGKSELYCREKRDAIIIYGINNKLALIDVEEIIYDKELPSLTD